jgi:hypothetical protein
MKTVKLLSIGEILTETRTKDEKASRQYYVAKFMDSLNPFAAVRQRTVFQDHNADGTIAFWKSGDPSIVKNYVGKEIPGQIVNVNVESYKIDDRDTNTFTTVLLDGESLKTILKQNGHVMALAPTVKVADAEPATLAMALNG